MVLAVVLPTVLYVLYALLWQSSGYVAEARVTVRNAQEQRTPMTEATSLMGKLSGGSKSSGQDAYIFVNYAKSNAIIAELGGGAYLEKFFSNSKIDFSRASRETPNKRTFSSIGKAASAPPSTPSPESLP